MSTFATKFGNLATSGQWRHFGDVLSVQITASQDTPSQVIQQILSDRECLTRLARNVSNQFLGEVASSLKRRCLCVIPGVPKRFRLIRTDDLYQITRKAVGNTPWYFAGGGHTGSVNIVEPAGHVEAMHTASQAWHAASEELLLPIMKFHATDLLQWLGVALYAVAKDSLPQSPRWVVYGRPGKRINPSEGLRILEWPRAIVAPGNLQKGGGITSPPQGGYFLFYQAI